MSPSTLPSLLSCYPSSPSPASSTTGSCHLLLPETVLTVLLTLILSGFLLLFCANGVQEYLARCLLWVSYLRIQCSTQHCHLDDRQASTMQHVPTKLNSLYFPSKLYLLQISVNGIIIHSGVPTKTLGCKFPAFPPPTATLVVSVSFLACLDYCSNHASWSYEDPVK